MVNYNNKNDKVKLLFRKARMIRIIFMLLLGLFAAAILAFGQESHSLLGRNGIGWNPGPQLQQTHHQNAGIGWNPSPGSPIGNNNSWNNGGNNGWGNGWNNGWGNGWNNGWNNGWGNGWGSPWSGQPIVVIHPVIQIGQATADQGLLKVVAVGYDAQGIWRVLPLIVKYNYNGVNYDVTVINAWNPWMDMWDNGVDQPAYETIYYLRGRQYNYYAPLSTGTYYFNL